MTNSHSPGQVELLAPAGNFEKLETAIYYGADAVYLAGKDFSLRNYAANFSFEEMEKGIALAHAHHVKVYVACNIYSRNHEQEAISRYLETLGDIGPDALIIADPGILFLAKQIVPELDIHLSTQANTTNASCARFWEAQGVKRINVARELSIEEINGIARNSSIEIEAFVHGAMCISMSGRCLLSSYMIDRDGNRGLCAQPCRWRYAVVEEKRPGEYLPIVEDERGAYIFNSRDLCMIEHLPAMIESGISSLKIEGRMKSINYLASAVKVYREAIDRYHTEGKAYRVRKEWTEELSRISNRQYCTGFYLGDPKQITPNYPDDKPATIHRFIGKIIESHGKGMATVQVRNKMICGDNVEILTPRGPAIKDTILEILDKNLQPSSVAQPNQIVTIRFSHNYSPNDLIRKLEEISYKASGR